MLDENRKVLGLTRVFKIFYGIFTFYIYSYDPRIKYIVINGDNIKYNKLKINNQLVNNNTYNLDFDNFNQLQLVFIVN